VSGIKDDIYLWSLRYDINRHGIIPLINRGYSGQALSIQTMEIGLLVTGVLTGY